MPRITISYRREDSLDITGRIFDRLAGHFGREAVFRDIDSIPLGADFRRHVDRVLDESDIILAIVGPRWIGPDKEHVRLASPADPVRLEIETALRMDKPLIPVLVSRAVMPHPDVLPDSLHDFVFRHAVQIDSGQDFDVHVNRLIRAMERLLPIDEAHAAAEVVQGVAPEIEASPSIEPTPQTKPDVDPLAPPVARPGLRTTGRHTVRVMIALGLAVILGIGASGWWVLVERPAEMAAAKEQERQAAAKAQQDEQARQAAAAKAQQEEQARQAAAAKAQQDEQARQAAAKAQQEEQARQAAAKAQEEQARQAAVAKAQQDEQARQAAVAKAQAREAVKNGDAAVNRADYAEAARWYRKAADQGDPGAQMRLGNLYYTGYPGAARDYAEAMRWYRKAADQGDASAEYGVGDLYETGRGVAKDNAEAIRWYQVAAKHGSGAAMSALERLGLPRH
jgi:chemotaxis protein histidine kinase CheA